MQEGKELFSGTPDIILGLAMSTGMCTWSQGFLDWTQASLLYFIL